MQSRTLRRTLGTLAAGLAALAVSAPGAAAHSNQLRDGCTAANGGAMTCFQIHGIGGTTHVEKFVQAYDTLAGYACNYHARFTVTGPGGGSPYWAATTSKHSGCYYSPRVTRTSGVERNFTSGSKACGSWYLDGSRVGTACNYLWG